VDWHRSTGPQGYVTHWGVSGYIEYPDTPEGRRSAEEEASKIRRATDDTAYVYKCGEWSPPDGQPRSSRYSPNSGGVLT
jgi:hypothetical protein